MRTEDQEKGCLWRGRVVDVPRLGLVVVESSLRMRREAILRWRVLSQRACEGESGSQ